ncbi:hypothetical protein [Kitasatospora phosalacinea]|uniref:Uncharacterized protein n=1 Tax=Kitasatospora phosalacinea TaxID=2065 RepID=A0ABW6GVB2_9ACTN
MPEEPNRLPIGAVTDLHRAPTEGAAANLRWGPGDRQHRCRGGSARHCPHRSGGRPRRPPTAWTVLAAGTLAVTAAPTARGTPGPRPVRRTRAPLTAPAPGPRHCRPHRGGAPATGPGPSCRVRCAVCLLPVPPGGNRTTTACTAHITGASRRDRWFQDRPVPPTERTGPTAGARPLQPARPSRPQGPAPRGEGPGFVARRPGCRRRWLRSRGFRPGVSRRGPGRPVPARRGGRRGLPSGRTRTPARG